MTPAFSARNGGVGGSLAGQIDCRLRMATIAFEVKNSLFSHDVVSIAALTSRLKQELHNHPHDPIEPLLPGTSKGLRVGLPFPGKELKPDHFDC